jgi:hypothetical protein
MPAARPTDHRQRQAVDEELQRGSGWQLLPRVQGAHLERSERVRQQLQEGSRQRLVERERGERSELSYPSLPLRTDPNAPPPGGGVSRETLEKGVREEVRRREESWEERDQAEEVGSVERNEWADSMANPVEEVLEKDMEEREMMAQWQNILEEGAVEEPAPSVVEEKMLMQMCPQGMQDLLIENKEQTELEHTNEVMVQEIPAHSDIDALLVQDKDKEESLRPEKAMASLSGAEVDPEEQERIKEVQRIQAERLTEWKQKRNNLWDSQDLDTLRQGLQALRTEQIGGRCANKHYHHLTVWRDTCGGVEFMEKGMRPCWSDEQAPHRLRQKRNTVEYSFDANAEEAFVELIMQELKEGIIMEISLDQARFLNPVFMVKKHTKPGEKQ